MKKKSSIFSLSMFAVLALAPASVNAKDWIEKVQISRDGIDAMPIEVAASATKYTSLKTTSHRFLMHLYAKATPGERIVAGRFGSYKNIHFFEAGEAGKWDEVLKGREIGGGESRTVSRSYTPTIKLNNLKWSKHPIDVCNELLAQKKTKGYSADEVLSKAWDAKTYVYFEFMALAARAGKAKSGNWNIGNTEGQRHSFSYAVDVKCGPGN